MTNQAFKDQAIDALAPFITYFYSVGPFRKIGLYLLVMMGNFRPSYTRSVIQQPGSIYHFLGSLDASSIKFMVKLVLGFVIILWAVDAYFVTNFLDYIILAVLLGTTCLISALAYAFTIARAGLLFQIRIPENYRALRSLIVSQQHAMIASHNNMVRYAPVAFHGMTKENFDAFRLLGILEGVLCHLDLQPEDFAELADSERELESDLRETSEAAHVG